VFAKWHSPGNHFVKDLCTDSILVMSATVNGDHTGVAYSKCPEIGCECFE